MLGLIVAALRARRAAALVMLVLAAVTMGAAVAAGAATGPLARGAATARVEAATPAERTLSVRSSISLGTQPDDIVGKFQALITGVPAERSVLGVRYSGVLRVGDLRLPAELRAVDGFCDNATMLQGRCAEQDGEIVLAPDVARQLGLAVGDQLRQDGGSGTAVVPLRLVGLYAPGEPLGWYWSGLDGVAAYTTRGTVAKPGGAAVATYDALLPASAFDRPAQINATVTRMRAGSLEVSSAAATLATAVAADRRGVRRGLLLVELQVLLVGGIAVAVAAAYAAQERRADAARMAIRGLPPWRILTGTAGQSLLPLLVGAAWAVALRPWLWQALAIAVGVVVAVEWPATRAGVPALLRVVQPRRPLVAATLEVCVLALGAAAVYQLAVEPAADVRRDTGLGLGQAAPLLIALAAGVLATRALLSAAGLAGRTALAGGRVGGALAGLTLGRRRTAYRIVPVIAAATCVLAVAAQDWAGAAGARADRAAVEVGADRVLRVAPMDREKFLAAVRAADPEGRHAMAVAIGTGTGAPVIAVDGTRLRAVTGIDLPSLRAEAPAPLAFAATTLTLRAAAAGSTVTMQLAAHGERVTAVFRTPAPPAAPGPPATADEDLGAPPPPPPPPTLVESTVDVAVPQCAAGCRLVSVETNQGPVELLELRAGGTMVVDGATFADPARWRTTLARAVSTVQAGQRDNRLRLQDVDPPSERPRDNRLYVVDTPVPLPAVIAGDLTLSSDNDVPRVRVFGVEMPVAPHLVTSVPRGGAEGVLVDLEYATHVAGPPGGVPAAAAERLEVWLGISAPADLPDRLRAAGITIAGGDSADAATTRAARLAPAVTLRAGLAGGAIALLLAAVTAAVVAAVDRRQRRAELTALRRQGLPASTARTVGRWTAVAPVLVAVPVGLAAAVLLRLLAPAPVRPFADRWPVPVAPVQWLAILATAVVVFAVLLPPALWSRSTRDDAGRSR
ncbi:hypothetical protein ACFPIJ_06615 [Dactylosporangium cerinum]|uniref:FtsX-like permease family protein n=1 Tax=Dactylosporangium cerinum TaxID=1434730 RepID=A0ABV9VME1_9ACTN